MRKVVIAAGADEIKTFRAKERYDEAVEVAISQKGDRVIEKSAEDIDADGEYITVLLTAEETAKLKGGAPAEVQFTYTVGGMIKRSKIQTCEVYKKL